MEKVRQREGKRLLARAGNTLYGEMCARLGLDADSEAAMRAEFERIPNDYKEVTPEQREQIEKLLEKFEDDDDVQNVFHNMKEDDTDEE